MRNIVARSPIDAWHQTEGSFRILLVICSPIDEPSRINPGREVEEIYRQLSFARVPAAMIKLTPPTWRSLHSTLLARHFDVVHFIGHARRDAIQFEKEDGTSDWVSAEDFAMLFQESRVRLVVLNNCNSEDLGDSLITRDVPVVIA